MKISIIRGAFLNPFELQNYSPLKNRHNIQAVSSLKPLNIHVNLPLVRLPSLTDLPNFPFKYQILNRLFVDIHYLFGLEKTIENSDIVHVAETYYHYTNQALKAKLKGKVKKVVSTVWEVIPFNNEGIRGRKQFKHFAYQNVDHFIAVTELAKQALVQEGVLSSKISVVPMGVDIDKFSPTKKNKSTKNVQILFVGREVQEKGIKELKEAVNRIRKTNPNVTLKIASKVPYSQIAKVYQKADIFCLPSKPTRYWQEQFGMALVEAMASGLPIVTTRTGAIPEVCGTAALYANPGDSDSLFRQLNRLVSDQNLREELGLRARQRAKEKYDSKKVAKQIEAIYRRTLSLV